jgi:hypothetical protein
MLLEILFSITAQILYASRSFIQTALLIFLFYLGFGYSFVELQEVTPNIYLLFEKSDWWQAYKCSLPHEMAMQRPYYSMQV